MKIVFTKSKKTLALGSKIIMLYQRCDYSHVAIQDGDFFYQASEGKINKEHITHFSREHAIVHSYDIPHINIVKLEKELGRNYSIGQNLGILFVDFFKNIGKRVKNPFRSSGVNCSEFVYTSVIIPLYGDLGYDKESIKPKRIKEILEERVPL